MAQMVRKQIYIDAESERFLKQRSKELDVTEAEVVRQALATEAKRAASDRQQQALDEILEDVRQYHSHSDTAPSTPSGWKFNREEMYEERMQELDRRREAHRTRSAQ